MKMIEGGILDRGFAEARKYSNEAALSLRSRRSGTKFATPYGAAH
jgi:hypothetical protein